MVEWQRQFWGYFLRFYHPRKCFRGSRFINKKFCSFVTPFTSHWNDPNIFIAYMGYSTQLFKLFSKNHFLFSEFTRIKNEKLNLSETTGTFCLTAFIISIIWLCQFNHYSHCYNKRTLNKVFCWILSSLSTRDDKMTSNF